MENEESIKLKRRNQILLTIISILLFVAVIGFSYAYFVADIKNSETSSTIFGEIGDMEINYDGGPNIVIGQMSPSNDPFTTKNFTVTGNSTVTGSMYYNISLIKESNTFNDYGLAYNLKSTNTGSNGTIIPSSTSDLCYLLTGTGGEVLGNGIFTGPTNGSKVHTYALKLYFPDMIYQYENQGKAFQFHISIEEGSKTASTCKQPPTPIGDVIIANNGGKSNITEAVSTLFSAVSGTTDNLMYKMLDDYGYSYYFRGAKNYVNNNLIFANHQWKIIRVNGDGSLRLIYNGTCPGSSCTINTTGTGTRTTTSAFNTSYNDNKYVGYMYAPTGTTASTSRLIAVTNTQNSTIKGALDSWYVTNLSGTNYEQYIADTIFCNDRQLRNEVGGTATGTGFGTSATYYAAYYKLQTLNPPTPTLKCSQENYIFGANDKFTGVNYNNPGAPGNNKLTYPVGLITADEGALAGLKYNTNNTSNYLYTGNAIWTMTPYYFTGSNTRLWDINANARLYYANSNTADSIRPVINLIWKTPITGSGTAASPYVAG